MKLTTVPLWLLLLAALAAAGFWAASITTAAAPASAQTGAPAQVPTLNADPGAEPGTVVLTWAAASGATRYWIAGIKQTDWDAGDFSGVIWTVASGKSMHTVTELDEGSRYAFTVAGGNDAYLWAPGRPWPASPQPRPWHPRNRPPSPARRRLRCLRRRRSPRPRLLRRL